MSANIPFLFILPLKLFLQQRIITSKANMKLKLQPTTSDKKVTVCNNKTELENHHPHVLNLEILIIVSDTAVSSTGLHGATTISALYMSNYQSVSIIPVAREISIPATI